MSAYEIKVYIVEGKASIRIFSPAKKPEDSRMLDAQRWQPNCADFAMNSKENMTSDVGRTISSSFARAS